MTIIRSTCGDIRGDLENGIHAFKGVPYAEPVGGRDRWLPPRPRRPWQGVRDARHYGAACVQFNKVSKLSIPGARSKYLKIIGAAGNGAQGDDSLLLNIWSPALDRNAKLPVMVYIHGGSFTSGAASDFYSGSRFAAKGVVAVAIQYRLGPPGFLHGSGLFDGDFCADNRAFLDQLAALRWIQDNIGAFGGDPGCVTIFGESAGAFALYQLAASPLACGLFHRGIAMGGMAATCAPAGEYHQLTRDVLKEQGISPGDEQALISLDLRRLRKVQSEITSRTLLNSNLTRYGSISRSKVSYMGAATGTDFLPEAPPASYAAGTPNNIDLLLGTCAQDGNLFSLALPLPRSISARLFSRYLVGLIPNGDMAQLRRHYATHMPAARTSRIVEQINNDAFYRVPTLRAAEAHAAGHPGGTYHYQLDYQSIIPGLGAIHGIDVALLFRAASANELLRMDAATDTLSELMLEAWTSFARTGRPTAPGLPGWPAFNAQSRATMVLDEVCRLEYDLDAPLLRYW